MGAKFKPQCHYYPVSIADHGFFHSTLANSVTHEAVNSFANRNSIHEMYTLFAVFMLLWYCTKLLTDHSSISSVDRDRSSICTLCVHPNPHCIITRVLLITKIYSLNSPQYSDPCTMATLLFRSGAIWTF